MVVGEFLVVRDEKWDEGLKCGERTFQHPNFRHMRDDCRRSF
jgi:hypothetical protein